MTLDITTSNIIVDETAGSQNNDYAGSVPVQFSYLLTKVAGSAQPLSGPEVAYRANFIAVSAGATETITNYFLAQNNGGAPFSTVVGVDSGLTDIADNQIYLYQDPANANVVLGVIGNLGGAAPSASTPLAFAMALDKTSTTTGDLYLVQYVALHNPDSSNTDEPVDLTNHVFGAVTAIAPYNFSDFSDVPSGNTQFAMIAPDATSPGDVGLLIVGFNSAGAPSTVNVSTTGIGAGAQHIGVNAAAQIDFVKGGTQGTGSASEIAYTSHIETIHEAGFKITQVNPTLGGNNRVSVQVAAFNVSTNEQGTDFFDGSAAASSPIARIQVLAADGVTVIEDTGDATKNDPTITITLNANGTANVNNLLVGQSVRIVSASTFDRMSVKNVDEGSNTTCDIGGFFFLGERTNAYNEEVGSYIRFEDDGPSLAATAATADLLLVDESGIDIAGSQAALDSNIAKVNFASLFTPGAAYGADGEGTGPGGFALHLNLTPGYHSGLFDSATGLEVGLRLGLDGVIYGEIDDAGTARTVFTLSAAANGDVTLTQLRAVLHDTASNPDTSETSHLLGTGIVTLGAAITDGDHDAATAEADLTAALAFADDGPTITADATKAPVLVVDESGLPSGSDAAHPEEATETADFSGVFDGAFGADGGSTAGISYALATDGGSSGLVDTLTHLGVGLAMDGNDVVGTIDTNGGADGGIETVFRIQVDAGTGEVTLTQYRAVEHDDATDPDEADASAAQLAAADLVRLVATIEDTDHDTRTATANIGLSFRFEDDGPSLAATAATADLLLVDESGIDIAGSQAALDSNIAKVNFASLFTPGAAYGADGEGTGPGGFALHLNTAPGYHSGLFDSATGLEVGLRLGLDGVIYGEIDDAGTARTVFTLSAAANGDVTLTQLRAVLHDTASNPDTSETSHLLGTGIVTLGAAITDGDHDAATAQADLTAALAFADDGCALNPPEMHNVAFLAGEHVSGNVLDTFGADGPGGLAITHASYSSDLTEVVNGNVREYYDSQHVAIARFTLEQDGDFNFEVLTQGHTQIEDLDFATVQPGRPVETLAVETEFANATITFDGLLFNNSVLNAVNYDDATSSNRARLNDNINADHLGFGIVGSTPSQASQINQNEGFKANLGEPTSVFQFDIQNIGNNASAVHVQYQLLLNGQQVALNAVRVPLFSGNHTSTLTIDPGVSSIGSHAPDDIMFDQVVARFYFQNGGPDNDIVNPGKNQETVCGVRVTNFGVKTTDTIPNYDFAFDIRGEDKDGDFDATTLIFHVSPDVTTDPSTLQPDQQHNWLV